MLDSVVTKQQSLIISQAPVTWGSHSEPGTVLLRVKQLLCNLIVSNQEKHVELSPPQPKHF